jgi:hypothetical protein
MSALAELLKQYGDGSVDDASAVEKVKALLTPQPEVPGENVLDKYTNSLLDDDNDYDNTWQEVSAAKVMGRITPEQYTNLYEGIFGGSAKPKDAPADA